MTDIERAQMKMKQSEQELLLKKIASKEKQTSINLNIFDAMKSVSEYDENGEYVDVYQKAREDQKTYLNADYNIIVDPDGNEIDCNGSHFTPSQQTISSLEAQECDYKVK